MATYRAEKLRNADGKRDERKMVGTNVQIGKYMFTSTHAAADVFQMVALPKGATVFNVRLWCDGYDTDSTQELGLSVGDGGNASRYISKTTIGQSGGNATFDSGVELPHSYTSAADTIDVTIGSAAGVAAFTNKYMYLTVTYSVDESDYIHAGS